MSRQPEGIIVDAGIAVLRKMGAVAIKVHGSVYARTGEPDVVGVYQGRAFAIEVKQPGGRPRQIQVYRLTEWYKAGALVGVATSVAEMVGVLEGKGVIPSYDKAAEVHNADEKRNTPRPEGPGHSRVQARQQNQPKYDLKRKRRTFARITAKADLQRSGSRTRTKHSDNG